MALEGCLKEVVHSSLEKATAIFTKFKTVIIEDLPARSDERSLKNRKSAETNYKVVFLFVFLKKPHLSF